MRSFEGANMSDVLVVFHSRTGHCRDLARLMSEQRGWELAEIAWPGEQPSYARCAKEAFLRGHPEIRYHGPDPAAYDVVVLVSPVWCWRLCPPMRSFIRTMAGKLGGVAVLSCMGGSGASNAFAEVEQLIHRPVVAKLALRQSDVDTGRFESLQAFADEVAARASGRHKPMPASVAHAAA
jgi:flavodoxin